MTSIVSFCLLTIPCLLIVVLTVTSDCPPLRPLKLTVVPFDPKVTCDESKVQMYHQCKQYCKTYFQMVQRKHLRNLY